MRNGDDRVAIRTDRRVTMSVPLYCQECGHPWDDVADHWRIYVSSIDPPVAFTYCRVCAAREFGD